MTILKKIVKKWIHPLVWERLGQAKQEFYFTKKRFHCDPELVPIFQKYFGERNGYYVEVGANDGRSFSNTYHLEHFQNWTGVLIEPVMHLFFRSHQTRSPWKNKFFNVACVSNDYKDEIVEMHYSGLITISTSETNKSNPSEWALDGGQFLGSGESVQKMWSQAWTLESILKRANSPKVINLLSVDVEESEYFVLKGVNFDNWLFEYILIETEIDSRAFNLLVSQGFCHLDTVGGNLLFCNSIIVNSA